jgi:hypothetical protein
MSHFWAGTAACRDVGARAPEGYWGNMGRQQNSSGSSSRAIIMISGRLLCVGGYAVKKWDGERFSTDEAIRPMQGMKLPSACTSKRFVPRHTNK